MGKCQMVADVVAFEAKARADAKAHEAKVQEILHKLKKEYSNRSNDELKDLCRNKELKAGGSKQDRIQRLLVFARENGEVDAALAIMAREARQAELLNMDEKALMELCNQNG